MKRSYSVPRPEVGDLRANGFQDYTYVIARIVGFWNHSGRFQSFGLHPEKMILIRT